MHLLANNSLKWLQVNLHSRTLIPLKNLVFNTRQCFCSSALDLNTKVVKDVILFKYSNNKFFKTMNIFAICQFGFWTYLAMFAFKDLRDIPVDKNKAGNIFEKINLGDPKYKYGLTIFSYLVGFGVLAISWMYTLRSVKYLILCKGGKDLAIVTYTPFGQNRILTVGLEKVSCKGTRQAGKSVLPIKIKGHMGHYLVDMKGEFRNPMLFDHTAGLQRKWKK